MENLKNAFHVTPQTRRIVVALVSIVTLNSAHAPVASAQELMPMVPVSAPTDTADDTDGTRERGFIVPEDTLISPVAPLTATSSTPTAEVKAEPAVRTMVVTATAYTSDPRETDSTPFITANNTRVRHGIIAANFLRFGTRVRIPEYYGDTVFEVTDRMNPKYNQRIDIWMNKKKDAIAWGARRVKIEILPPASQQIALQEKRAK